MRRLPVVCVLALLGAAPPEVPKEVKLTGAGLGRIEIAVPDGTEVGLHATFSDAELFFEELAPKKGRRRFLLQAQPGPDGVTIPSGKYSLTWWTKGEVEGVHTTITVLGKAAPDPVPDPKPKPDPTPEPGPVTPTKLYVVVVDETADRATATRGRLLFDPTLAARFTEKGHVWRVIDKDVVGADGKPPKDVERFLKLAAEKPYPSYYLVDTDGKVRGTGAVPAKAADLLDAVKKVGG